MLRKFALAVVLVSGAALPAAAQTNAFDPLAPCSQVLGEKSGLPQLAIGFWAFGFLDAATGEAHLVTVERMDTMLRALGGECAKTPDARMYDIAVRMGDSQKSKDPPVADAGRELLLRFFDPSEDRHALTQSLRPTPDDVRTVYAEPLATALLDSFEQGFESAVIQPKPGQTQLLSTFTTTGRLKAEDPVLDEFPGGYKEVLQYIIADVPIARFKFVEPGETLGLAFDGLIFVNDHWVIMPKPWRVLPE